MADRGGLDRENALLLDIRIGARFRASRIAKGMSQSEVGELLGVTFQQIQKYERGTNRIAVSTLYRYCVLTRTPMGFFFEELQEDKEEPTIDRAKIKIWTSLQRLAALDRKLFTEMGRLAEAVINAYAGQAESGDAQSSELAASSRASLELEVRDGLAGVPNPSPELRYAKTRLTRRIMVNQRRYSAMAMRRVSS